MSVTFSGIRSTSAILVPQGGTGKSEITSGSLLVGNGANAIEEIAPGSEGQVLKVVGGVWTPAAESGGGGGGGGGLSTVTTSGNIQGDGSVGSPVTLKSSISLTSVTASFSGNGSSITGLSSSQISDFNSAVDARIPASSDPTVKIFTANGFSVGQVVALSGSLVAADKSDNLKSNAIGVVSAVSGSSVTVKLIGEVSTSGASSYANVGTPVYVGTNGSVVDYGSLSVGDYVTQVGFISDSGKIMIQLRIFGQL